MNKQNVPNDSTNPVTPNIEKGSGKGDEINVSIRINDKPYTVIKGVHKVADIKTLGGVPAADELSGLINGKLKPLNDNASTNIKGGEEFFSCKREGTSS